jgi:hypothetical protein
MTVPDLRAISSRDRMCDLFRVNWKWRLVVWQGHGFGFTEPVELTKEFMLLGR